MLTFGSNCGQISVYRWQGSFVLVQVILRLQLYYTSMYQLVELFEIITFQINCFILMELLNLILLSALI